jgi:hypothetical protein
MASELIVQTLKGPTSGANANKIIVPSGQTLDASAGVLTPSAGAFLQTQYVEVNTEITNASSTWANTGLSLNFTPNFSNSKVLVTLLFSDARVNAANSNFQVKLLRNNVDVREFAPYALYNAASNLHGAFVGSYLETANTTSQVTYNVQFRNTNGDSAIFAADGAWCTMTIQEIKQ